MTDYSIAAIPTEYKGRMYRSRLEARWAAFFDHLGWEPEYEPFDLGQWSPDFLLRALNVLVEVKPITEFDGETWGKIVGACTKRRLFARRKIEGVLLTLLAPQEAHHVLQLGWFVCRETHADLSPCQAFLGWLSHPQEPTFGADIVGTAFNHEAKDARWFSITQEGGRLPANRDQDDPPEPESYLDYSMKLWARASSDVQWHKDEAGV
jgi:hypothetical protein